MSPKLAQVMLSIRALVFLAFFALPSLASAEGVLVNLPAGYGSYRAGTILIHASARNLYVTIGNRQAIRYRVAVPKAGKAWRGETVIERMVVDPDWVAPASVAADHPELAGRTIPGGAPNNPMGTRAIVLQDNNYVSEVAIHGTTKKMRASIGTAASYGCIRMLNEDVEDLYARVRVGSAVIML